jgi:uncharacterized protein (DUF2062 family)
VLYASQKKMAAVAPSPAPAPAPAARIWLQRARDTLTQPLSAQQLSFALSLGLVCGVFPLPGVTSGVTVASALLLGANVPVAQLVNLLATPLDIALVPFFIAVGERALARNPTSLAPKALLDALAADLGGALRTYGSALFAGVLGWALLALPLGAALHFAFLAAVSLLRRRPKPRSE